MKIYVDGGGKDRNGQSRIGILPEKGQPIIITIDHGFTSNEAEYMACLVGCAIAQPKDIILADSQLVVMQGNDKWKCKARNLQSFCTTIKTLVISKSLKLKWVPRDENRAGKALEQRLKRGI